MPDNIEPIPYLILLTLVVAAFIGIGIRDRIRTRRAIDAFAYAVDRMSTWAEAGACAHLWIEADQYHVCTRPFEHTGPHRDQVTDAISLVR